MDCMYDNIKNGRYDVKMEYPTKPKKPLLNSKNADSAQARAWAKDLMIWEAQIVDYKRSIKKYREEHVKMYNIFRTEAIDDVGLEDHPKVDNIFNFAWEKGHSAGYYEVYVWLCELSEMLS